MNCGRVGAWRASARSRPAAPAARGVAALASCAAGPDPGLRAGFPNAVGLAAGFDKNARAWPAAAALGFGHVEIGTVTHLPQPGNPRPRLFRYPPEEAIINRMGFNNEGTAAVAARLARQAGPGPAPDPPRRQPGQVEGRRDRPGDRGLSGQLRPARPDHADYLVLNVSSPNTPGLRGLQEKPRLRELLGAITAENRGRGPRRVPLLLKIAPDLDYPQIDDVLGVIAEFGLDGIIATNTTLARPGSSGHGGSGWRPERRAPAGAFDRDHPLHRPGDRRPPARSSAAAASPTPPARPRNWTPGRRCCKVYTGMIYRGPFLAREIAAGPRGRQAAPLK